MQHLRVAALAVAFLSCASPGRQVFPGPEDCIEPPPQIVDAVLQSCVAMEMPGSRMCGYITQDPPGNRCVIVLVQPACHDAFQIGGAGCEEPNQKSSYDGTL